MTTKAYDEILARKMREREEGNKGMERNIAMGMPLKIPHPVETPPEIHAQPKRRGRPPGSKNKPK